MFFFFLAALAGPVGEPGVYIPATMSIAIFISAIVATALKKYHYANWLLYLLFFIALLVVFVVIIIEPQHQNRYIGVTIASGLICILAFLWVTLEIHAYTTGVYQREMFKNDNFIQAAFLILSVS